ncbi:hypothetical protein DIPPA_30549 [Diplonema papillatum]|nr:hypothetical protein DIPPA_30549 [Diplonema papillatum]
MVSIGVIVGIAAAAVSVLCAGAAAAVCFFSARARRWRRRLVLYTTAEVESGSSSPCLDIGAPQPEGSCANQLAAAFRACAACCYPSRCHSESSSDPRVQRPQLFLPEDKAANSNNNNNSNNNRNNNSSSSSNNNNNKNGGNDDGSSSRSGSRNLVRWGSPARSSSIPPEAAGLAAPPPSGGGPAPQLPQPHAFKHPFPEANLSVLSPRAPAAVRTVYHLPPPPGAKQPGPCSIVSLSRGSHAPPVQAAAPAQLLPPSKRSAFSVVVVAPLDHLDHKGERPSCCMVDIEVAAVALDGVVAP